MPKNGKGQLNTADSPPQELILACLDSALSCAKMAARHKRSLTGGNFYADKMAELRASATCAFARLSDGTADGTAALVEMIEQAFAADVPPRERTQAARDLRFALRT